LEIHLNAAKITENKLIFAEEYIKNAAKITENKLIFAEEYIKNLRLELSSCKSDLICSKSQSRTANATSKSSQNSTKSSNFIQTLGRNKNFYDSIIFKLFFGDWTRM
jgi:hypothetical protein